MLQLHMSILSNILNRFFKRDSFIEKETPVFSYCGDDGSYMLNTKSKLIVFDEIDLSSFLNKATNLLELAIFYDIIKEENIICMYKGIEYGICIHFKSYVSFNYLKGLLSEY